MRHLEYAFDAKNQIWRYIVLLILVFIIGNTIGGLPLGIIVGIAAVTSNSTIAPKNMMDFEAYGVDQNLAFAALLFVFAASLIGFILLLRPFHKRTLKGVINGGYSFRWNNFSMGFLVWSAFLIVSILLSLLIEPENMKLQFDIKKFIPLFFITLLMVPLQTTFEEVIFRGYLMQGLATKTRSRFWSMLIISLAFGFMHIANPEVKEFGFFLTMPQYIIMGLLLGIVSVLDDGIEVAIGIHAANNMLNALFITYSASAFQTPSLFVVENISPLADLIQIAIFSIAFIFILKRKYGWRWEVFKQKVEPFPLPITETEEI